MNFDSVIEKRASIRNFKPKQVSWKNIIDAIDLCNLGPYAGNQNNLRFLIIEDPKKIDKIAKNANQAFIKDSSIVVLICSDDKHLENLYGSRGLIYSRQQAGATIMTFLLKMTDFGLGACWVGAYHDSKLKSMLKIPKGVQIEAIIPIGYPEETPKKTRKKPLEASLYWEEWNKDKRPTAFQDPKSDKI